MPLAGKELNTLCDHLFVNFKMEEFRCSCSIESCPKDGINLSLLYSLQDLRFQCEFPFIINSGYRCLEYNTSIGSKPTSQHVQGLAVDISSNNMTAKEKHHFISKAVQRFSGVGIQKTFFHLDIRPVEESALWIG